MSAHKIIITIIGLFLLTGFTHAQPLNDFSPQPPGAGIGSRIWVGGNLGLQFGTVTLIQVNPLVGYRLTPKLTLGVTGNYIYLRDNTFSQRYSTEIYGGGLFGRYFITDDLYAHTEYEILSLETPNAYGSGLYRTNVTSVLVGGGYRQWISDRAGIDLMLLWNVNQSRLSPYSNPIIRVGFIMGI